ncbi:MAG: hypothetical protein KGL26_01050 [Pseudomonadota bacterium]|nr:hypothetical protein [Pseudomonadota bacterium]
MAFGPPNQSAAPGGIGILPIADQASDVSMVIPKATGKNVVHVDARTGTTWTQRGDSTIMSLGGEKELVAPPPRSKTFDENLAERPDLVPLLHGIASRLRRHIEADIAARREWEETGNKGADMLGIKWEEPRTDVSPEGTLSVAHHSLMLESLIQTWANSRAELLPAGGPVKVKDDLPEEQQAFENKAPGILSFGGGVPGPQAPLQAGPQQPGTMPQGLPPEKRTRSQKADALEGDMNHYLTSVDREYYPDTSRMLLTRALKGSQFKKVYLDPVLRRPVSRWVKGTDLIISNDCSHLSGASRVTERQRMRQGTVKRMQAVGHWRKVAMPLPTNDLSPTDRKEEQIIGIKMAPELPADYQHQIMECYCELDDGAFKFDERGRDPGYPLPYRVTFDWDSYTVLEVRRNWKKNDRDHRARCRYVHYGFVPGLTFYHWGLTHILANTVQRSLTAMQREFIDAEMFASFPGGIIRKSAGARTDTTDLRVGPGKFKVIDTGGDPIGEAVHEWPYKGASPGMIPAIEKLENNGRRLVGMVNMPVGEGRAGLGTTPVGTIMAYLDSVSKVPSAVHKDDHMSQAEEFNMLRELLAENPQCLAPKDKRRNWQWTAEELADAELQPAADPNVPSSAHRVMQGTALVQLSEMPQFNGIANIREIWEIACRILGLDPTSVTLPPPPPGAQPPPDPKMIEAMQKDSQAKQQAVAKQGELMIKQQDSQRQAADSLVEAQQREQDRQSQERIEAMKVKAAQIKADAQMAHEKHIADQEHERAVGGELLEHARHVDGVQQSEAQATRDAAAQANDQDAEKDDKSKGK